MKAEDTAQWYSTRPGVQPLVTTGGKKKTNEMKKKPKIVFRG